MRSNTQPELGNKQTWCNENRLKLNVKQSKTLFIASRAKLGKVDYTKCLDIP